MGKILELDEVLDMEVSTSKRNFTTFKEKKLAVPDGIVNLFSLIMARIIPRCRFPLGMRHNWAAEDSDFPGTFWVHLYEVIATRGLFWTRHRHIDIVDSHYDCERRKLSISFQCPGDYNDTMNLIKDFISEHPELEIRTLVIFIWEETPTGQHATKLEKVFFF